MFYDSHSSLPSHHKSLKRLIHSLALVSLCSVALVAAAQMKVSGVAQPGVTRLKWTKPVGVTFASGWQYNTHQQRRCRDRAARFPLKRATAAATRK
jgi:hypothetical protein